MTPILNPPTSFTMYGAMFDSGFSESVRVPGSLPSSFTFEVSTGMVEFFTAS